MTRQRQQHRHLRRRAAAPQRTAIGAPWPALSPATLLQLWLCGALAAGSWACGSDDAPGGGAQDASDDVALADGAQVDSAGDDGLGGDSAQVADGATDATGDDVHGADAPIGDAALADGAQVDAGSDTSDPDASDPDASSADASSADTLSSDAATPDAGGGAWSLPTCVTPTGAPGVAFGPKSGQHLHLSAAAMQPGKSYTMGLAATGVPGLLYAEHAGTVYRSTDSGCSWAGVGSAPTSTLRMVGAAGPRAYAFYDNGATLLRVDGTQLTTLTAPTTNILGVMADPSAPDHVRLGAKDGQLWQSTTGGVGLWKQLGVSPAKVIGSVSGGGYRVAIAPTDLDRALYGVMVKGFAVTQDGGKTWTLANFQGAYAPQKINGMNAVFAPQDEDTVWAMAIDLNESIQNPSKTNGKYLWRSKDAGQNFVKVVGHLEQNDVTLTNGVHLVPDPVDNNVVRWAFGTCFSGYGTNLYAYDFAAKKLSWVNHPVAGFAEFIHHPADPKLLVIGLRGDNNPQCPTP